MKRLFLLIIVLIFPFFPLKAAETKEKAFVVTAVFEQGEARIQDVGTGENFIPRQKPENELGKLPYRLELFSIEGKLLEKRIFDFPLSIFAEPPGDGNDYPQGSGGEIELDYAEEIVIFPYHPDSKLIVLYDPNLRRIDDFDVSFLTVVCGNGECQPGESAQSCPKDCPAEADGTSSMLEKDSGSERLPIKIILPMALIAISIFSIALILLIAHNKRKESGTAVSSDNIQEGDQGDRNKWL